MARRFDVRKWEGATDDLRQKLAQMQALGDAGRETRIAQAKRDFAVFCRLYFPHYMEKPVNTLHRWIFTAASGWAASSGSRVNVIAPRGYAKTTYCVRLYLLWRLIREDLRFAVICQASAEAARDSLEVIRAELEDNPRLAQDFPEVTGVGNPWRKMRLTTRSGVHVVARGAGQRTRGLNIRGRRPDLVLCDDLDNDEAVKSKDQRQKIWNWFTKVILQLGPPGGGLQAVLVGTLLHADCVVARASKRRDFETHTFRALSKLPDRLDLWDEWGRLLVLDPQAARTFRGRHHAQMDAGAVLLWPEVETLDDLMAMRAEDPGTFASEKQNSPLDPSRQSFKDISYYTALPDMRCLIGAVDPALGRAHGDDTAIIILGHGRADHKAYVLEAILGKLDPLATVERVVELQRRYQCAAWRIEDVAFQSVLMGLLAERGQQAGVPIPAIGVANRYPKEVRIMSLQPHVAQGRILFSPNQTALIEQLSEWPQHPHDDGPDALEMAHAGLAAAHAITFKSTGLAGAVGRLFGRGQRGF